MFELVPEPVWKTSIGNWSSCCPFAISSPAAAMRSARSPSSRPSSALTRAAVALMRPSQRMTGTGIGCPDTGKFATALFVSPPQSSRRSSVVLIHWNLALCHARVVAAGVGVAGGCWHRRLLLESAYQLLRHAGALGAALGCADEVPELQRRRRVALPGAVAQLLRGGQQVRPDDLLVVAGRLPAEAARDGRALNHDSSRRFRKRLQDRTRSLDAGLRQRDRAAAAAAGQHRQPYPDPDPGEPAHAGSIEVRRRRGACPGSDRPCPRRSRPRRPLPRGSRRLSRCRPRRPPPPGYRAGTV